MRPLTSKTEKRNHIGVQITYVALTQMILEENKLLGISVFDNLVKGHGDCVSLREYGLGFVASRNALVVTMVHRD